MCRILRVSRSGFYAWHGRSSSARENLDKQLRVEVRAFHWSSRGTCGSPRLLLDLKCSGRRIGRNRPIKIMRKDGLSGRRKTKYVPATNSNHSFPFAVNILNRKFNKTASNQAWVGDIAYIKTMEGWVCVAVLLNLLSRRVAGWAMEIHMRVKLPLKILEMACQDRLPPAGLSHHTISRAGHGL